MMVDCRHANRARTILVVAGNRGKSGQRLQQHVLTRAIHVRPAGPIARSGRVNDTRILSLDLLITKPQPVHHPRTKVFGNDVRFHHQLAGNLNAALGFEVERHAALVTVGAQV